MNDAAAPREEWGGVGRQSAEMSAAAKTRQRNFGKVRMTVAMKWNRRRATGSALAAALSLTVGAAVASAEETKAPEGFIQPSPTVQKRLYSLDGSNEVGVFGAFSLNNILTQHNGGAVSYTHNFGEYIGVEVLAGGGAGGLTSLTNSLRQKETFTNTNTSDMQNAGALLAYGQVGARLTPFYGKFNLAAELPVHFDFYLALGVGVALVNYNSVLGCNQNTIDNSGTCPEISKGVGDFHHEMAPAFAFNGGGGMRLFITKMITVRVEVRDLVFPDKYYTGLNLQSTAGQFNQPNKNLNLTQVPLIFAGVGFLL
jgi:outer membrane beta-barrel protein